MKKTLLIPFIIFVIMSVSCSGSRDKKEEVKYSPTPVDSLVNENNEISFYYFEEQKDFPDAIIEMYSPLNGERFKPGKIPFEFNIKNYPFGEGLTGVQLNIILNSGDPIGYNSPIFQRELNEGTYRVVAYLLDNQGLALKEFGNYVDRDFLVGDSRPFPYSAEPYLAVNLPFNGQTFPENTEITVDFLVIGGDLELDGLKVQLSIDGFSYEINKLNPIRISHLPKGEHAIQLKLLKNNGTELDGPFSSIQKTVIVQ